jgi:hypothetical protein
MTQCLIKACDELSIECEVEVIKVTWSIIKLENSKVEFKDSDNTIFRTWDDSFAETYNDQGLFIFKDDPNKVQNVRKVRITADPNRVVPFDLAEVRVYANVPVYEDV